MDGSRVILSKELPKCAQKTVRANVKIIKLHIVCLYI